MALTGTVTEAITRSRAVISVSKAAGGLGGFFVENPAGIPGVTGPILFVVRDQPFAFSVTASGRRGFEARLEVRGRDQPAAPLRAVLVQSADNFDPNGIDTQGSVLLDRWSDSHRSLTAVSREMVKLDGADIDPDDRQVITLKVVPLIKFDAAGLRWTDQGPFCSRQEYEELAALMAAYGRGEVFENVTRERIPKMIRNLRELKSTEGIFDTDTEFTSVGIAGHIGEHEVDETDALFDVPTDFSKPLPAKPAAAAAPAPAPAPQPLANPAQVQAALDATAGVKARPGFLAHGSPLAVRAAVPIVRGETGGEVTLDVTLFVFDSPEALEAARNRIKPT
jgi:hypothetical protein